MTQHRPVAVVLALVATPLVGCDAASAPNDGDCNADIRWEGNVYRPHNALDPTAPSGERLGTGAVLDCDGTRAARAEVFAIEGVDPAGPVKVLGEWRGVYVAEGTSRSAWPEVLNAR